MIVSTDTPDVPPSTEGAGPGSNGASTADRNRRRYRALVEWLVILAVVLLCTVLLRTFVVQSFSIPSLSM